MKNSEKFNKKLNMDTASAEKIQKTNEELVQYMRDNGEDVAAKQIQRLIDTKVSDNKTKSGSDPALGKLLITNKKILATLDKIYANMYDEQDTRIKSISNTKAASVALSAGALGASASMQGRSAGRSAGTSNGAGTFGEGDLLGTVGSAYLALKARKALASAAAKKATAKAAAEAAALAARKQAIKKAEREAAEKAAKEAERKATQLAVKKGASEAEKAAARKIADDMAANAAEKKVAESAAKKGGTAAAQSAAKKTSIKAAETAAKVAAKETIEKAGEKAAVKASTKIAAKTGAAALKMVPFIGQAVTLGIAAWDAKEGWENASQNLGIDKSKLSNANKAASAVGGAVSGMTFGLADSKNVSRGVNNLFGGNDIIKAFEKAGIMKYHFNGDSEIIDYEKLKKLTPSELSVLLAIDDWSRADKQTIEFLIKKKQEESTKAVDALTVGSTKMYVQSNTSSAIGVANATGMQTSKVNMPKEILGDEEIKKMIKEHEGKRNKPYKDTLGLWTVGYGHLIGDGKSLPADMDREYSDEEIEKMFEEDYAAHKAAAEKIPGFNKLNEIGKGALTDLTFNMGGHWYKKWPKFTNNISKGNIEGAAEQLENSKWYTQVGNRAPEIVSMVRAGSNKQETSGVSSEPPMKTSSITSEDSGLSKLQTVESISDKTVKEVIVQQNGQNLKQQTVAYDTGTQTAAVNAVVPVINRNINTTKSPEADQHRLLGLFS